MMEPSRVASPPTPVAHAPARAHEPGTVRVLLRGLAKRCPRCGERGLFLRWLKIRDRCPRCGLRLEREEGGFLGAMTINYTATTVAWAAFLAIWLLVDLPGVAVAPLTVASLGFVAAFPLVFFPFSKTIWAAVDYLVLRSGPG
jgi:uncharacterized protein (DUF983 family)